MVRPKAQNVIYCIGGSLHVVVVEPSMCVCVGLCVFVCLPSGFTGSKPINLVSTASISQSAFWLRACQLNTWPHPNWACSRNCSALINETLRNTASVFKRLQFWRNLTRCCIHKKKINLIKKILKSNFCTGLRRGSRQRCGFNENAFKQTTPFFYIFRCYDYIITFHNSYFLSLCTFHKSQHSDRFN